MTVARSQIVDPLLTPWYHCISHTVRRRVSAAFGLRAPQALDPAAVGRIGRHLQPRGCGLCRAGHAPAPAGLHRSEAGQALEQARRAAALGPALSAAGSGPQTAAFDREMGPIETLRPQVHQHGAETPGRPGLVHEVAQGTAGAASQPGGRYARGVLGRAIPVDRRVGRRSAAGDVCLHRSQSVGSRLCEAAGTGAVHVALGARGLVSSSGTAVGPAGGAAGSALGAQAARGMESGLWLCPLDDRRGRGETRVGLLDGFSLGSYLLLVDATSRLLRPGKARSDPR